ncbi:hypothetical protein [Actinophytocola gossypii]|uniref:SPOR domain-containing protein n=1 Tax=Actinophytocola gossypii TaxID=2812003 RepID=A0ABT2JB03_9PSEU|nr:hypothetical protein [Actinophytocola gossypii]MCT2585045.1 hypothetical protein [Actinophytocola gossypii]
MAYTLFVPLGVIGVLAVVLWWASNLDTDKAHRKEYGLLRSVATVPSATAARIVEERLRSVGVPTTTVPAEDGEHWRVLVFPTDQDVAVRTLLRD